MFIKRIRSLFFHQCKNFLEQSKITFLRKERYEEMLWQRFTAVKELADHTDLNLSVGLNGIIFSMDRALQLCALIESYYENVVNPVRLIVIYKTSTIEHYSSYQELIKEFGLKSYDVEFMEQSKDFRNSLLNVLSEISVKSIFFLVDDIIFIRKFDISIYKKIDSRKGILSFRLSPSLRKSYTTGRNQRPPKFHESTISDDLLKFKWFEKDCEWSDPWSVDGNVYSTAEIFVLTRISKFKAPNSYEDALKSFRDFALDRDGYCFKECKILNLAINRVQSERTKNISGNITPEFLLNQWNNKLAIDWQQFQKHIPLSPHEEHDITFRRRW